MALFRKELRALRPFLWLALIIVGLDTIATLATQFPDQFTLSDVFDDFDASFAYFIHFALAFAIGQTLIQQERNDETLEFIDALPVSRSRVYWTKWLAGYVILSIFLISGLVLDLPLFAWSITSADPSMYVEFWGWMLVMDLILNAVYLSIGMALAFWGRFGLLAVAFYLIGIWILKEAGFPSADQFDPLFFGHFNVIGSTLHVPWEALMIQLGASTVLALIGQLAFSKMGKARESVSGWKRAATPLFIFGLVGFVVAWIVASVFFVDEEALTEPTDAAEPVYAEWATTRLKTKRFVFIYPNNLARAAEELAAEADEVHDTVTRFFGTEPQREIIVDLTSNSPRHAGTAYWGRIRMNLQAEGLEARLPAVLGHELCHIYIDQLSENRVSESFETTRFFHEGLASVVEYRFFRPAEELAQIRRVAAAAHDRNRIRFEDLASSTRLSEEFAAEWVYPLGEVFASAIIDTWGDDAPATLIRAFNRPDAPTGLQGLTLWQDTFQAAGYDLETAIGAFFRILDAEVAKERDWLDQLPKLRGQLVTDDDRVGVRVLPAQIIASQKESQAIPPRKQIYLRFRAGPGAPENEYQVRRLDRDNTAWISREFFPGGAVDFQIIYSPEEALMMPLFDPWVSARVPGGR